MAPCSTGISLRRCLHEINDPENPLFTVNYSADGKNLLREGRILLCVSTTSRTKTLVSKMEGGYHAITKGHSNRVFSLVRQERRQYPRLWRMGQHSPDLGSARGALGASFYGPHVCGDAVDI